MTVQDPRPGVTFEVEYRIIGHSNAAANYYYTKTVEMFAFEEDEYGNLLLLLTEECRESIERESIREYTNSLKIDPENPTAHPHVEAFSEK